MKDVNLYDNVEVGKLCMCVCLFCNLSHDVWFTDRWSKDSKSGVMLWSMNLLTFDLCHPDIFSSFLWLPEVFIPTYYNWKEKVCYRRPEWSKKTKGIYRIIYVQCLALGHKKDAIIWENGLFFRQNFVN